MNPPEPILPPTSTLNPTRLPARAGTSAISCDSLCVQFSKHPVTVTLNFLGRLVNSGLPSEPTRMRSNSKSAGEASKSSFGVRPARGQPLRLRTLSMPVCREWRLTPRSFSQISGMLASVKPRNSICCRVVMSKTLFPRRRETSAMV